MPRSKRRPKSTASATSDNACKYWVLGIDNGARSGVTMLAPSGELVTSFPIGPKELRWDALHKVVDRTGMFQRDLVRTFIELPWGGFMRSRLGLMREFGRWVEAIQGSGFSAPTGVMPGAWQRVAFAGMEDMRDRKEAAKRFAVDVVKLMDGHTSDVYDSACIAWYGRTKLISGRKQK